MPHKNLLLLLDYETSYTTIEGAHASSGSNWSAVICTQITKGIRHLYANLKILNVDSYT